MGTALENFADFVKITGPSVLTSARSFVNEAALNSYTLRRFLRNRRTSEVIQGGRKIIDEIMFDENSTYQHYDPSAEFQYTNLQVLTEWEIPWRFSFDQMSWTEHEIELNIDDRHTEAFQMVQYKELKAKVEKRMWTSLINGFESDLWADAHNQQGLMEANTASGAGLPYSIPAFITEESAYHADGWTEVQGIDPANESGWRNQTGTYDYDDPDDSDGDGDGLFDAFDTMSEDIQFEPPDFHNEHFENASLQMFEDPSRQIIYTTKDGKTMYKRLLRASNDTLVSKQDAAYTNIRWAGLEVVRVPKLETAAIYDDGSSGNTTEDAASSDGARFYFVNGNYLKPVWHRKRYFHKKDPYHLQLQPYNWVCPVDCWWNLVCRSRRRQGIVSPQ